MPDKENLLRIYERMLRIRLFEQKATELFGQGLVTGSMHLYIGEEAIAVGAMAGLHPDDDVVKFGVDIKIYPTGFTNLACFKMISGKN